MNPDCPGDLSAVALAKVEGLLPDAAFANPEIYEFLEAEGIGYTIRLPANRILQDRIGYLLKRPLGATAARGAMLLARFGYRAQSWNKSRHAVAKVEWHPGELYPRVRFTACTSVRGAGIECDKQRRHDEGKAPSFMRQEAGPIDSAARGTHRG